MTELHYDPNGLIPAVLQDAATGEVLMVAWMNAEALQLTRQHRRSPLLEPQSPAALA